MKEDREQRIKNRAHGLWEKAGRPHGLHDEHWSQATREIEEESKTVTSNASAGTSGGEETVVKKRKSSRKTMPSGS